MMNEFPVHDFLLRKKVEREGRKKKRWRIKHSTKRTKLMPRIKVFCFSINDNEKVNQIST